MSKWIRISVFLVSSVVAGALLAELIARIGGFDERFLERHVYRQGSYPSLHEECLQADLLYRLKGGARATENGQAFSINAQQARGPERAVAKDAGVYRVVVLGGSNVFGTSLDDAQTWPAQLERELSTRSGAAVEVWNFGTPAYVATQMVAVAREAREKLAPDLFLFAFSNAGIMAFLDATNVRGFYRRFPALWAEQVFSVEQCRGWGIVPPGVQRALLLHSHAYRLIPLAQIARRRDESIDKKNEEFETLNVERFRAFVRNNRDGAPIAVFVIPWVLADEDGRHFARRYTEGLDLPVLSLTAEGLPDAYRELHPGPEVMRWYAQNLANWMLKQLFAATLRGDAGASS